jgi:hypothetical protein
MKSDKHVSEDEEEKDASVEAVVELYNRWKNEEPWGGDVKFAATKQIETLADMLVQDKAKPEKKIKYGIKKLLSATGSNELETTADAVAFITSNLLPGMRFYFSQIGGVYFDFSYFFELEKDQNDFLSNEAKEKCKADIFPHDVVVAFKEICKMFENATDNQLAEHMIAFLKSWNPTRVLCYSKVDTETCNTRVATSPACTIYPRRLSADMTENTTLAELDATRGKIKNRQSGMKYNKRKKNLSWEKVRYITHASINHCIRLLTVLKFTGRR